MNAIVHDNQRPDDHEPGAKWEFNEDVARKFDSMLHNSIPGYVQMRDLVHRIGSQFVPSAPSTIIDLGASRGESSAAFIDSDLCRYTNFVLSEISDPMREQMRVRFADDDRVAITGYDLRKTYTEIGTFIKNPEHVVNLKYPYPDTLGTTLVLSILTLIFVPINFRQSIIQGVYDGLAPGGAFIVVEKVLGNTALTQDLLVDSYHKFKNDNGYSWESIERKRAALEGVQVPVRSEENLTMLRSAGFRHVEVFWRHLNFEGIIAIKEK